MELKACPFCGETDIRIQGGDITCSMCGPFRGVGIEQWNLRRRAMPPAVRAVVDCLPQLDAWRGKPLTHADKCGCAICDAMDKIAALEAAYADTREEPK